MEPPIAFQADAVRDEKLKVLRAIRRFSPADIGVAAVRGQYGPGTVSGTAVPGYRQEPGVDPTSSTPTPTSKAMVSPFISATYSSTDFTWSRGLHALSSPIVLTVSPL